MTKITWRGEDDGPPSCIWNGVTFPVGVAVEVANEWMIAKARGNRFFTVEDYDPFLDRPTQWREPATEADSADDVFGDPKPMLNEWKKELGLPPDYKPDVSFFDDPPGVETPLDEPPEDEPKRKPGQHKPAKTGVLRPNARKVISDGNR